MTPHLRAEAEQLHALLASGQATQAAFRAALRGVPSADRDAWLDVVLGLEELYGDGAALPVNCTPYLPCPVGALLSAVQQARVEAGDVFVDIGSGVGRAALLVHLLTGASVMGLEVQPELVAASRALARRLNVTCFTVIEADAMQGIEACSSGSVFFLYCPFGGVRLERVVDGLERIAWRRQIRVCCVQLALPERPWLLPVPMPEGELTVFRSRPPASAGSAQPGAEVGASTSSRTR